MECAQSLELLSDLNDGLLAEAEQLLVRAHLDGCPPCCNVFYELQMIVVTAKDLHADADIAYPDETVIWQRLTISTGTVQ
jgi:anti-sigma factor RsiW